MKLFGVTIDLFNSQKVKRLELEKEELEKKLLPKNELISKLIYNVGTKALTLIFNDGDVLTGNVDQDIVDRIKIANDKSLITKLMSSYQYEVPNEDEGFEEDDREAVSTYIDVLHGHEDFDIINGEVYFKGITSIAIPSVIVAAFVELVNNKCDCENDLKYKSLKAFTLKLLLNPIESSRNQLLTFVKKNDVRITSFGNLVLYRRCISLNENKDLIEFISKSWIKVKGWKKSPKNYVVFKNQDIYSLSELGKSCIGGEFIGNLDELYYDVPNMEENVYTSAHDRSIRIKLGEIYSIPEEQVDLDSSVCHSGGLHVASVNYNYSSYGNTPLVVLVNPSKTITVPSEEIAKMRVSEMFIVGIHENVGNHVSDDFVHDFDEKYHNNSIEELEEALKNKSLATVSISEAVSELTIKEVVNITDKLKNRIITI